MHLIKKLWQNFCYSLCGLTAAFKRDLAFRLEILALVCLAPVPFLSSALSSGQQSVMLITLILPMTFELFNSAIEVLCDTITKDFNHNIKFIKDVASAAVLISVITMLFTWGFNLWPLFF